jgi:TonB-linked SusC/RagA family outer membrane protein
MLRPLNLTYEKINEKVYVITPIRQPVPPIIRQQVPKTNQPSSQNTYEHLLALDNLRPDGLSRLVNRAKAISVSGKVTEDNGQSIPGVNVLLKGTMTGTVTNTEGQYNLTVPDGNGTLIFSYIGYTTEEVLINSRTTIDITLVPDVKSLSEVVVVGYGEQKRSDITGSVASVKAEEIKNLPVRSVAEAMQGRVAGVVVTQDDGNPRAGTDVVIRGPVNINGRGPLYVVDGIPFIGTGSAFNIQDVESIEVLKDASAAAIYGTLGSGGVILVTTKKGKSGKMRVTGNANYGLRQIYNQPKFLQKQEYIRAKTAFGFDAQSLFGDPANYANLPDTDWLDEIYNTGKEQNYTLALSGGSDKSTFYTSVNYNRIDGPKFSIPMKDLQ